MEASRLRRALAPLIILRDVPDLQEKITPSPGMEQMG
jgi:hypothetical protein